MTAELCADTGRPDSRELSRVVAVKLLTRSGVLAEESLEFRPTGTVTRTPVDPGQLVPGDPTGLAQAAAAPGPGGPPRRGHGRRRLLWRRALLMPV